MNAFNVDADRLLAARTERRLAGIFSPARPAGHWNVVPGWDIDHVLSVLPTRIDSAEAYEAGIEALRQIVEANRRVNLNVFVRMAQAGAPYVGEDRAVQDCVDLVPCF